MAKFKNKSVALSDIDLDGLSEIYADAIRDQNMALAGNSEAVIHYTMEAENALAKMRNAENILNHALGS